MVVQSVDCVVKTLDPRLVLNNNVSEDKHGDRDSGDSGHKVVEVLNGAHGSCDEGKEFCVCPGHECPLPVQRQPD